MNKEFYKKILSMLAVISFFTGLPCICFASVSVTIIGHDPGKKSAVVVDFDAMKPFTSEIVTVDPNFKDNGRVIFSGITLKKLFEIAHVSIDKGVTVVGRDQYVEYIPLARILKKQVILAFAMNGQPISRLEGGPLKIIYDASEGVHGSGYTWYVETIFSGGGENLELTVKADGKDRPFFFKELNLMAKDIEMARVSIPCGSRNDFPGPKNSPGTTRFSGIFLKDLLRHMGIAQPRNISLIPFAGPAITLERHVLDYPVILVCSMDGACLHPVFGGPFSIQFPLEDYPEIEDILPESGAFFLLKQISIH